MNAKVLGLVLIVIGVALAVWGYNVYDAVGSQLSRTLSGDTPVEAWIGMAGGAICILVGILKLK